MIIFIIFIILFSILELYFIFEYLRFLYLLNKYNDGLLLFDLIMLIISMIPIFGWLISMIHRLDRIQDVTYKLNNEDCRILNMSLLTKIINTKIKF